MVTAAVVGIPQSLVDQLAPGGIMVVPVGRPGADQTLLRVTRNEDGFHEQVLGDVRFVPLLEGLASDGAAA
jgi:protein-L-isoaspartate(D-aspartate) O-methyltransferase